MKSSFVHRVTLYSQPTLLNQTHISLHEYQTLKSNSELHKFQKIHSTNM